MQKYKIFLVFQLFFRVLFNKKPKGYENLEGLIFRNLA